MIIAAALMLLSAPASGMVEEEPVYEEIVVTARVGRVALIFDRAPDGRLINCRVFRSSGTQRIDDKACNSLPDCVTSTKGQEYCGGTGAGLTAVTNLAPTAGPKADAGLSLGVSLKPEPTKKPAVGPVVAAGAAEEDPNRLGKLPPPPKDESRTPAITLGPGQGIEPR